MFGSAVSRPSEEATGAPIRVALTYRVLFHWRTPVFRRLARSPGIEFLAFHGSDFPGTKAVNGSDLSGFRHRRLATIRLPVPSGREPVEMPLCPTLPVHLARFKPDVILAEGGSNLANNVLIFAYALLTGTPVVWWTLGELPAAGPLSLRQRLFRRIVGAMERRSTALLGYSSLALRYFERQGYPRERQFRAVNCIDTEKAFDDVARHKAEVAELRDRFELVGKTVLLYVGAMAPSKRLEDLIDAYVRLRARHPALRLLLVGDGSHRPSLEKYARTRGASDAIFAGQVVDGVSAYFLLGDVFVLPGLGGLAISQAMAHGLPVVATAADGCELDLIEEGGNGYLLPVGDVDELVSCLGRMIEDPDRLRAMGARSLWIIKNRYNIESYVENVLAAIFYAAQFSPRARPRDLEPEHAGRDPKI